MTEGPGNHTIRSDRWRYIHYGDGGEELYDHLNEAIVKNEERPFGTEGASECD